MKKQKCSCAQTISLSNQLAKEYASKFEDEVLEVIPEEMVKNHIHLLAMLTII